MKIRCQLVKSILSLIFFSLLLVATSCKNKSDVVIKGNISNLEAKAKILILRQDFSRTVPIDSIDVSPKKGKFRIVVKAIEEPTFIQLHLTPKKSNTAILLVEAGEEVTVEIDAKNFSQYQVAGSEGSEKTKLLSSRLNQTIRTLDSLKRLMKNSAIDAEKERFNMEYIAVLDSQRAFSSDFIIKNAMSRASVMAVYQQYGDNLFVFDRLEDLYLLKVVATSLKAFYPESDYTKGMLTDIQKQERQMASLRMNQIMQEAESTLPEIELPNTKGEMVKLSSLRGKIILLDFWASGNQTSLFENLEFKEIYKKYQPKGFEIYQVSLDNSKEAWLDKVESTELPWINVFDPNESAYVAKIYNVTNIPANYLINKNFEIVGKNLTGKDLERKIKELI